MSEPVIPELNRLEADNVIEGARLLRVILDGGTYNGQMTAGLVHGLAALTVSVMLANAALAGAEGTSAQAAEVRRILDAMIEHATFQALAHDEEGARG